MTSTDLHQNKKVLEMENLKQFAASNRMFKGQKISSFTYNWAPIHLGWIETLDYIVSGTQKAQTNGLVARPRPLSVRNDLDMQSVLFFFPFCWQIRKWKSKIKF